MSNSSSSAAGQTGDSEINPPGMTIRAAGASDLPAMCQLSFEQGWPHRIGDWLLMLDLAEAVVLEDRSSVIGCGLRIAQGDRASLALILVQQASRGRGLGKSLMQTLIEQSPTPALFLNATEEGAPLYRKYGFIDAGCVVQWQGICRGVEPHYLIDEVEPLASADCAEVRQMLQRARGIDPDTLIWAMERSQERLIGLRREGVLQGVASLRRFGRGWVIGPVIGRSEADAMQLIEALAVDLDGEFLRVDIPEPAGLEPLLQRLGLSPVDRVKLMYRGDQPSLSGEEKLFALFSQATG